MVAPLAIGAIVGAITLLASTLYGGTSASNIQYCMMTKELTGLGDLYLKFSFMTTKQPKRLQFRYA